MPATTRSATKRRGRNDRSDGIRRQRSSDDLTESDAIANLNVNWVGNWFFFWYIIGILLFRWCCHLVAWTHGATAWTNDAECRRVCIINLSKDIMIGRL